MSVVVLESCSSLSKFLPYVVSYVSFSICVMLELEIHCRSLSWVSAAPDTFWRHILWAFCRRRRAKQGRISLVLYVQSKTLLWIVFIGHWEKWPSFVVKRLINLCRCNSFWKHCAMITLLMHDHFSKIKHFLSYVCISTFWVVAISSLYFKISLSQLPMNFNILPITGYNNWTCDVTVL